MKPRFTGAYAVPKQFNMAKWVGGVLGAIFFITVIGAGTFLAKTFGPEIATKLAPTPKVEPVAEAKAEAKVEAAPSVGGSTAGVAALEAPAVDQDVPKVVASKSKHKHGVRAARKVAAAPAVNRAKANSILARHDSRKLRAKRDEIDRLLGL